MPEKILYVVMCGCTGSLQPVAYIDDHRPADHPQSVLRGLITVSAPTSQTLVSGMASTVAISKEQAQERWSETNLTKTFWTDGHVSWTLRCLACGKQAQMRRETIISIADKLALVDPSSPEMPYISMPDPDEPERRMIQLGVLCDRIPASER